MPANKVVIVNQGRRGDLSDSTGSYDTLVEFLVRLLEYGDKPFQVEVVRTVEEVRATDAELRAVVFVSLSMRPQAQELKRQCDRLVVIVLTGLMPDDEPILINKGWLDSGEILRTIIRVEG